MTCLFGGGAHQAKSELNIDVVPELHVLNSLFKYCPLPSFHLSFSLCVLLLLLPRCCLACRCAAPHPRVQVSHEH
jgi:cytochrome b561